MRWANFFHVYQPPHWPARIVAKVARESYRPLIKFLLQHRDVRVTVNLAGSLTEQLRQPMLRPILVGLRRLLERGQIELTDSAIYHAILPLLPASEIRRQIALNRAVNRRALGRAYQPAGFFPPEMAYSPRLGQLLGQLGYRWVILDGISHPGLVNYESRYQLRGTRLGLVFRNRYVSDYLAFEAQANDIRRFFSTVQRWNGQKSLLITAMDGENLGHHRRAAKKIWQQLVHLPTIETVTVTEALAALDGPVSLSPRAASWSSRPIDIRRGVPFGLWKNPNNPLHVLQWRLFSTVLALVRARQLRGRLPRQIRHEFDQVLTSDWYWWASREPWWDVEIVGQAAERLGLLAEELSPPSQTIERVRRLIGRIKETSRRWHASGAAERHIKRFMRREPQPRYLGGKSVS
ncbi:MAG: polysaccharide deacetylase family protein [Candidatus Kerfeldbacteria bacterium]|nr:polysaccharide deacetylase family protein [Candidatus Kerfeldbacteria bacterium]